MLNSIRSILKDEEGGTLLEYGIEIALIIGVVLTGAKFLGIDLNTQFR